MTHLQPGRPACPIAARRPPRPVPSAPFLHLPVARLSPTRGSSRPPPRVRPGPPVAAAAASSSWPPARLGGRVAGARGVPYPPFRGRAAPGAGGRFSGNSFWGLSSVWQGCVWARYLATSSLSFLVAAAPRRRTGEASWASGAPALHAGGVGEAAAWLAWAAVAARHGRLSEVPGASHSCGGGGGRGLGDRGSCLCRRWLGGQCLAVAWGRLGLPGQRLGQDRSLHQALLLPLCRRLCLTSWGGGEAAEGPAVEAVVPLVGAIRGLRFVFAGTRRLSAPGGHLVGQVISSPPGPSGGPSETHLLPGRGVPRVHRARSPVLPQLPRFATPRSVHQFAAVAAGAYPLRRPPNAWLPGAPAPPVPCYWLVASGTPLGWRGGCLA